MIINVQEGRKVDKHTMIGCQNIVEFVAYKCLAFKSREGGGGGGGGVRCQKGHMIDVRKRPWH